ncbi:MAG: hypothetical protein WKF87_13875 [Chryseolinea sp.]
MRLVLILLLFLFCCRKEESDFVPIYSVPQEMEGFVKAFREEGATRGVELNINNLIIRFDSTMTSTYCGECNSSSLDPNIQKIISVNPFFECWYSEPEREAFFFHELGHCVLGRLHDRTLLPNGDPKSIMVESGAGVYAPCIYDVGGEPCDNGFKRPYYLDELFNEATPTPDWAK